MGFGAEFVSYSCFMCVLLVSLRMSHPCLACVRRMSYTCPTCVVRLSYSCPTRVLLVSYSCHSHTVIQSTDNTDIANLQCVAQEDPNRPKWMRLGAVVVVQKSHSLARRPTNAGSIAGCGTSCERQSRSCFRGGPGSE